MLSSSITLHRKPKDGKDGADGTSLTLKGKCIAHYANHAAIGSSYAYAKGDLVIVDSSADVPSGRTTPGSVLAATPSVLRAETASTVPYWLVWQAAENDGYVDADGDLWLANDSVWTNMGHIRGDKGDKGDKGDAAVTIYTTDAPLIFDTDANGVVTAATLTQYAKIYVRQGNDNITSQCTFSVVGGSNCSDCAVKNSGSYAMVKVGVVATAEIANPQDTSQKISVSAQAGYVDIAVTYGGVAYRTQVPWQVNLTKFSGSLYWDDQNLTSKYSKLSTEVGGLSDDYSEIKQSYDNISLKVGEQHTGRTNLLRGSACKRQGEGWAKMSGGAYNGNAPVEYISRTKALQGVNTLVCKPYGGTGGTLAGFHWVGGAPQGNIPLTKDAKYTFSFWAKADDVSKVEFVLETIWASSLTSDRTSYIGPSGTDGGGCSKTFTANQNGTWQLFTRTVIIPADAAYSFLEVCLFARALTSDQTTAYISRPMMELSENYNGWTLSANDTEPTGGNMLENTRLLRVESGKNLTTVSGTVTVGAYEGNSQLYASALTQNTAVYALIWSNIGIERAQDYTLSFMAKGTGTLSAYLLPATNCITYVETSASADLVTNANGRADCALTSEWQRFTVHWQSVSASALPTQVYIVVQGKSAAYITQPKLERGATPTAYTAAQSDQIGTDQLLATGIDIANKKITVTANQFSIQNNSGETTATVDADGRLTVNDGEFKGTVRASNFYHGVHILGQTEVWYRVKVQDSEGKLKQGEYYTEAQIVESGADDYELDDTIGCTGPSDIILLPIDTSGEVREVRLPDPKDFEGKVVEVSDLNYSDASPYTGAITVSALGITQTTVDDGENGFTAGIYSGAWAGASLYDSFPKGTKVRYLALHYQNSYYWCMIDKRLYKNNDE